jgi:DNA-binding CsgD family transcriptional regulator
VDTAIPSVVGREEELEAITSFLDARGDLPGALVLEGEAGIGKTTLWRAGLAAAGDRGYRVLACRASGAEVQLSFAALGDLLQPVLEEALPRLSVPQQRALKIALLLEEAAGQRVDRRAIGLALLNVLRSLQESRPVLVAVDDVQWLDDPSGAALEFSLRRLEAEQVGVLMTLRLETARPSPFSLAMTPPSERVVRHELRPLSLGALYHVLRSQLGMSFPRPLLHELHSASGGNPLYATEIARALQRHPQSYEPGRPLPIPQDLEHLVRDRLAGLPAGTCAALLAAASLSTPSVELVSGRGDLSPAVEAGIVRIENGRVVYMHPLFASGVYALASPEERGAMHRALAGLVEDPEGRARHVALAVDAADSQAAEALDAAARLAYARGAPGAAAELLEHALRLTPEDERESVRVHRTIEAATAHFEAGTTSRALELLEELSRTVSPGPLRAEVLWRLGTVRGELGSAQVAVDLYDQALEEAADEPLLSAWIHRDLAWMAVFVGDVPRGCRHGRAAVGLAERAGEPALLAEALAAHVLTHFYAGHRIPSGMIERALALEHESGGVRIDRAPSAVKGLLLVRLGEVDAARSAFRRLHQRAVERGDETNQSAPLFYLTLVECLAGNLAAAGECAREGSEAAEQSGVNRLEMLCASGVVDAHLGQVEVARAAIERVLAASECDKELLMQVRCLALLGFLELSCGDALEAHGALSRAGAIAKGMGIGEPSFLRFVGDDVEALIALGRLDEADALLASFEHSAARLRRSWAGTTAARARGLLLAAKGDLDGALVSLEKALRRHERVLIPFERGRTLLALGSVHRRAQRKQTARKTLSEALAVFERLGARLWAERAASELRRIGGRSAPAGAELSETERRIAQLVASGRSNKEISSALSVSVKTVEWNLSKVYRKLGVRSRTELATLLSPAGSRRAY